MTSSQRNRPCPLVGVIDTISRKRAPLIIHVPGNTSRVGFSDLMKELGGISPRTLTDRLVVLQKEGFVGREAFSGIPPRVEYFLIDDGKEHWDAILPLLPWTIKRENFPIDGCSSHCSKKHGHH
jgi:DNA-binding HxlR family transcriptional regulator